MGSCACMSLVQGCMKPCLVLTAGSITCVGDWNMDVRPAVQGQGFCECIVSYTVLRRDID